MKNIRKMIIMVLAVVAVIAIAGVTYVENAKANSNLPPGWILDENGEPVCVASDCATHGVWPSNNPPVYRRIDVKEESEEYPETYKTGAKLEVTEGFTLQCSLHNAEYGIDYDDSYKIMRDKHWSGGTPVNLPDVYTGPIAWTSSNPSVASVTKDGLVKGLKPGKTVIKVQYGELSTSFTLTVYENKYTEPIKMQKISSKKNYGTEYEGFNSVYFDKKGNLILKYTSQVKLTKKGKKYYKKATKTGKINIALGYFDNAGGYGSYKNPKVCIVGAPYGTKLEARAKMVFKYADHKKSKVVTTIKIKKKDLKFKIPKEKIDLRKSELEVKNFYTMEFTQKKYKEYKKATKKK